MKTRTAKTRFKRTNPNPKPTWHDQPKPDCAVRAVAIALEISWEEAYKKLADKGLEMYDVMNSDPVIYAVLKDNGFEWLPYGGLCKKLVCNFAEEHRTGTAVLLTNEHTTVVKDGKILDDWDTSLQTVEKAFIKKF